MFVKRSNVTFNSLCTTGTLIGDTLMWLCFLSAGMNYKYSRFFTEMSSVIRVKIHPGIVNVLCI